MLFLNIWRFCHLRLGWKSNLGPSSLECCLQASLHETQVRKLRRMSIDSEVAWSLLKCLSRSKLDSVSIIDVFRTHPVAIRVLVALCQTISIWFPFPIRRLFEVIDTGLRFLVLRLHEVRVDNRRLGRGVSIKAQGLTINLVKPKTLKKTKKKNWISISHYLFN